MTARAVLAGASILMLALGPWAAQPVAAQDSTKDVPVTLDQGGGGLSYGSSPDLRITGFGVAGYTYDAKTHDNSFGAGKLAVGLFRELSGTAYAYGQLTTAVSDVADPGADEATTEIEIDNLLISATIPGASSVSVTLGKLDLPIGFERDDEPLQFLASPSYNFALARPVKMVGVMGSWTASPALELQAFVFNGWNGDLEPNQGKTVGARIGVSAGRRASFGLSGLYGSEGVDGAKDNRYLATADYAWQPSWDWIVAGEANYGGDHTLPGNPDQNWAGAMLTLLHQFTSHAGIVARAEVLSDKDGARTGTPQTLTSWSLAPIFSLGTGRDGLFANVDHTTFRIPRLQLRVEGRLNHSTEPAFDSSSGPSQWGTELRVLAVTTF